MVGGEILTVPWPGDAKAEVPQPDLPPFRPFDKIHPEGYTFAQPKPHSYNHVRDIVEMLQNTQSNNDQPIKPAQERNLKGGKELAKSAKFMKMGKTKKAPIVPTVQQSADGQSDSHLETDPNKP